MTSRLLAVLWLVPALALGAERKIVLHPMEVETKRDGEQMAEAFEAELAAQGVVVVGKDAVTAALAKQKGKVCPAKTRTACLAQLCKKAKADVALWTSFQPDKPAYTFDALFVRCDGKVEREVKGQEFEKEKKMLRLQGVRNVLKRFVAEVVLGPTEVAAVASPPAAEKTPVAPEPVAVAPVPVAAPVATPKVAPTVAATPPPQPAAIPDVVVTSPPPPERHAHTSGLRVASYVIGGAGIAALGTSGALALVANSQAGDLKVDANGNIPVSQIEVRKSADTKATAAAAMVGVGAALVAAGVTLFVISGSDTELSFAPTPGGAVLVFGGPLP